MNGVSNKKRRSELRSRMTRAEVLLWQQLRANQLGNTKFRRQTGIGPYIVDFYSSEHKFVIEVDGDSHFWSEKKKQHDKRRDLYLNEKGFTVLRFTDDEIRQDLENVLEKIKQRLL